MLELHNLQSEYADFVLHADLTLGAGSRVAILGPSGGGKSTLMSLIGGFIPQNRGHIKWQGKDISPLAPGARPVATLFQAHNLFAHLSLGKNAALALDPHGRPSQEQNAKTLDVFHSLGIGDLFNRLPREVSGGQAQRAAIARAILQNRPVTLLDEPFAALGPRQRRELRDLVTEFLGGEGKVIVMATHQIEDTHDWASHILWIENGRAMPPIPASDFFDTPPQAARDYLDL